MDLARRFEGKKYMWNGETITNENDARNKERQYVEGGFDVKLVIEQGEYFIFTRRTAVAGSAVNN